MLSFNLSAIIEWLATNPAESEIHQIYDEFYRQRNEMTACDEKLEDYLLQLEVKKEDN